MHETEAKLHAVAARRWRIAIWLSVLMLTVYYGFILLVAFNKPLLGSVLASAATATSASSPGLSLGILLGALVIVSAWILTGIYVYWANTKYDHEIHELAHLRG
jgi:Predicted membrane protein